MSQTWKNGKKTNFGPNLCPLDPNLDPLIFFPLVLPLLLARHCSKLSSYAI